MSIVYNRRSEESGEAERTKTIGERVSSNCLKNEAAIIMEVDIFTKTKKGKNFRYFFGVFLVFYFFSKIEMALTFR